MRITNELNLPQALVNAVSPEPHNKENCISATTLLHGVKDIILTKRHWDDLEEDASTRVFAVFGTAVHKIFEDCFDNEGVIREQQLEMPVGKYTLTGRVDRYDPSTKTIYDYKSTSIYKIKSGNYNEWYRQLMIYAYLLKNSGYEVQKLEIVALVRDWSRSEAKRDTTGVYPKTAIVKIPFDVADKDFDDIEKFITDKVAEIERCEQLADDDIPPCSIEERWGKPDKWAAMSSTGKKAIKLCDTEEEAKKISSVVEFRPGTSTRCNDYCSCCERCNFYKAINK